MNLRKDHYHTIQTLLPREVVPGARLPIHWQRSPGAKLTKTKTGAKAGPSLGWLASRGAAHYRTETVTEYKLPLELVSSGCKIYYNF